MADPSPALTAIPGGILLDMLATNATGGRWTACQRRAVQGDDRHQYGACAVSQRGGGDDRPAERQVQLYFGTTASSLEYVRTGKLRALAVTIERRLDALPDIPGVAEFVPGYEASGWFGVGAEGSAAGPSGASNVTIANAGSIVSARKYTNALRGSCASFRAP
jgi:Tripartite tricarboxylate transporter family receptor